MKTQKVNMISILCFVVAILLVSPVYAAEQTITKDILAGEYTDYFDTDEFNLVRNAVKNDTFIIDDSVNLPEELTRQNTMANSDIVNEAYKVHEIEERDFIKEIKEGNSVKDLILDEYLWYYIADGGAKIDVRLRDNSWEVIGYGVPTEATTDSDIITVDALERAKAQLVSVYGVGGIEDMVCFGYSSCRTDFVLFTTDKGDFLVPFSCRPDFTNLNNGQVYTPLEVAEKLEDYFNELNNGRNGTGIIGGYGGEFAAVDEFVIDLPIWNQFMGYFMKFVSMFF